MRYRSFGSPFGPDADGSRPREHHAARHDDSETAVRADGLVGELVGRRAGVLQWSTIPKR